MNSDQFRVEVDTLWFEILQFGIHLWFPQMLCGISHDLSELLPYVRAVRQWRRVEQGRTLLTAWAGMVFGMQEKARDIPKRGDRVRRRELG